MVLTVVSLLAAVGITRHQPAGKRMGKSVAGDVSTNQPAAATTSASPVVTDSFRAAVLAAFRESNPLRRSLAFGTSYADWFRHDPEAALTWLRQMPQGSEYTQGMFIALPAVCKTDPQRALALAADMAVTHEQKAIYNTLFAQLAQAGLQSAIGWLQSVPPGEARENALRAVTDNWAASDISGVLDWAMNLEDTGERAAATESVLAALAVTDPQRALDLATQNLDGGALDRIEEKSLRQLAATDPQAAAAAVSKLPAGDLQQNAAMTVARALAAQDPATALSWLQTLPDATQPVVLNNVLDVWLKQDPAAAGQYVAGMSAGPAQDAVVSRFAENWAASDVAAAVAWAQNLASSSAQNAAVVSIASGWARLDAAAATQWAASLPAGCSARPEAMKGAYSYWELADATAAGNYLKTLPAADQNAIKPSGLAQN